MGQSGNSMTSPVLGSSRPIERPSTREEYKPCGSEIDADRVGRWASRRALEFLEALGRGIELADLAGLNSGRTNRPSSVST